MKEYLYQTVHSIAVALSVKGFLLKVQHIHCIYNIHNIHLFQCGNEQYKCLYFYSSVCGHSQSSLSFGQYLIIQYSCDA